MPERGPAFPLPGPPSRRLPYRLVCGVREPILYTFAFGMNLNPECMGSAIPVGAGWLEDHRLRFCYYADVTPCAEHRARGAVWEITPEILKALDSRENYPTLYDRQLLPIQLDDGTTVTAWVYLMPGDKVEGAPSSRYIQIVREGYHYFDMDEAPLDEALRRVTGG